MTGRDSRRKTVRERERERESQQKFCREEKGKGEDECSNNAHVAAMLCHRRLLMRLFAHIAIIEADRRGSGNNIITDGHTHPLRKGM